VIAGVLADRETVQVGPGLLALVDADEMWDRYGAPAVDWLESQVRRLEAGNSGASSAMT
jgi:hypothetical protein